MTVCGLTSWPLTRYGPYAEAIRLWSLTITEAMLPFWLCSMKQWRWCDANANPRALNQKQDGIDNRSRPDRSSMGLFHTRHPLVSPAMTTCERGFVFNLPSPTSWKPKWAMF
jgi:uncharacterized MAPEG superfamily protein